MGWETKGKPSEPVGEEFAVYVNAFWVEGDVLGGVYITREEALQAARELIVELEGLSDEETMLPLLELNEGELEERIAEQDVVGFAQVAKRDILFT
jgi:hypothetical protein